VSPNWRTASPSGGSGWQLLARESAEEAPTFADVAPFLDRLPYFADRLAEAPQGELRALYDALQLDVVYQPAENALDVALTLFDPRTQSGDGRGAEDWLAPPAGLEPAHPAPESTHSRLNRQ
jgi:hypothetical protein